MQLGYNKALVLGATSGIGWALTAKIVETGTSVVAVGRRKDKLDQFAMRYGTTPSTASVDTAVFDIANLGAIPRFADWVFTEHPDLDCVFLNAGVQRAVDWSKPEDVDLGALDMEILTNYTSYMHLAKAFLTKLQKMSKPTSLVFTTSGLALVPIMHCPNYCSSKAALHHTILVMREQLRAAGSNVKIIELLPPAVQTELHDFEMGDKGKAVGMPLDAFVEEAFAGLCSKNNEQVAVENVKNKYGFDGWEQDRQKNFRELNAFMLRQYSLEC